MTLSAHFVNTIDTIIGIALNAVMPVAIVQCISSDRFGPYLREAGFNSQRALDLYIWNLKMAASFMPLLASIEVALRNRILVQLEKIHGLTWWSQPALLSLMGGKGKGIVKRAETALTSRGQIPSSGRIAAELTFGFWGNMLLPKYDATLWADLHLHFPNLPLHIDRTALFNQCETIRELRNRISHHEPLLRCNISQSYADGMLLLSWLSEAKAVWLRPHLNVMATLREKP